MKSHARCFNCLLLDCEQSLFLQILKVLTCYQVLLPTREIPKDEKQILAILFGSYCTNTKLKGVSSKGYKCFWWNVGIAHQLLTDIIIQYRRQLILDQ